MILDIRGRRGCRPQRRQGHPSPRGLATKRRLGNRFRIRRDRANVAGHGTSSPAGAGSGAAAACRNGATYLRTVRTLPVKPRSCSTVPPGWSRLGCQSTRTLEAQLPQLQAHRIDWLPGQRITVDLNHSDGSRRLGCRPGGPGGHSGQLPPRRGQGQRASQQQAEQASGDGRELRNVLTTLGERTVLILGRFTERKALLEGIADKVRSLGYLPIVFDFDRPTDRDLTETVKVLAGLSLFVVADITNPRSVPLELQATVPDYMVPFVTLVERGQPVFGMFADLPRKYDWALPLLEYNSAESLLAAFENKVVAPALEKLEEVRRRKALPPPRRSAED